MSYLPPLGEWPSRDKGDEFDVVISLDDSWRPEVDIIIGVAVIIISIILRTVIQKYWYISDLR